MLKPDYRGGSIVNLMASVGAALGAPASGYAPLRCLPPARLEGHRNIVLLLVDGLGHEFLIRRGRASRLVGHLERRLTSVFPPTTASAVTSFFTGVAPQQHAVTGWFTYLEEAGSVATILPFHPRGGGTSYREQGITPRRIIGHPSLFGAGIERPCHIVTASYLVDSEFSRATGGDAALHPYRDLDGLFAQIERRLAGPPERSYIFAYWPRLDALAHEFGVGSAEVDAHFRAFDIAFGRFLDRIHGSDTIVVAVADHGLVDTTPETTVALEDHPDLIRTLALPLCGEPRAAYCYVRRSERARFERYVTAELGHCCALERSADLVAAGYFGLGPAHPRLRRRVGDYVVLMRDGYAITDRVPGEPRFDQIGVHGGLTRDELFVPLVVVTP